MKNCENCVYCIEKRVFLLACKIRGNGPYSRVSDCKYYEFKSQDINQNQVRGAQIEKLVKR